MFFLYVLKKKALAKFSIHSSQLADMMYRININLQLFLPAEILIIYLSIYILRRCIGGRLLPNETRARIQRKSERHSVRERLSAVGVTSTPRSQLHVVVDGGEFLQKPG